MPAALMAAVCAIFAQPAAAPAAAQTARERAAAEAVRIAGLPQTGEPVQCLMVADTVESRPVGTSILLVRQGASRWYRNRLQNDCPTMRPDRILSYRVSGSLACRGDALSILDPVSRIEVGPCILGDFEPIAPPFARTPGAEAGSRAGSSAGG